ncbi:MAG: hypothetical protein JWM56_684 [Candidatus Peribacteria bacterium]|nr:hypothetical protein [Candidatus Peribacteria bacterium]
MFMMTNRQHQPRPEQSPATAWPELPYDKWKDTRTTLHMWTQVVGKVKLALAPFLNQWWEVTFFVTATGLTTGPIPYEGKTFEVDFDFLDHTLSIRTSTGKALVMPLVPKTVAAFYREFMNALTELGIHVTIWPVPVEVSDPIPFEQDTSHASYNKDYVTRWWRILRQTQTVFESFRTSFRGKSSPIHFFWGSFDLSGTRFSGRMATPPRYEGVMGRIMEFAENEENFAFGFWPGDNRFPHTAFFSYLYPEPPGIRTTTLLQGASFHEQLGECILPYDAVCNTEHPDQTILDFLESTYTKSAELAGWDISSFRTRIPPLPHGQPVHTS